MYLFFEPPEKVRFYYIFLFVRDDERKYEKRERNEYLGYNIWPWYELNLDFLTVKRVDWR